MLITTSTMAQGAAEVWINKVTTQLQNKGAEINFRINEEGIRISGKLLMEGKTYNQVIEQTDISSATLSRVSRCVQYGGGYAKLLKQKE